MHKLLSAPARNLPRILKKVPQWNFKFPTSRTLTCAKWRIQLNRDGIKLPRFNCLIYTLVCEDKFIRSDLKCETCGGEEYAQEFTAAAVQKETHTLRSATQLAFDMQPFGVLFTRRRPCTTNFLAPGQIAFLCVRQKSRKSLVVRLVVCLTRDLFILHFLPCIGKGKFSLCQQVDIFHIKYIKVNKYWSKIQNF